ncbi:hypothetical protein PRVXT_001232 [Proteinivorax tanatarense]|uniref:Uncharacterized protein n=1 Tax=Proteinivorax tanatarense TaxID=1260629 RepID=A0AAU7VQ38_9FIRM
MIYYLKKLLLKLKDECNMTTLVSTHNMSFVEEVCGSIAIVNDGEIVNRLSSDEKSSFNLEKVFMNSVNEGNNQNVDI